MHALCKKAPFALLMRAHGSHFYPDSILVPPDAPLPLRAIAAALREGPLILKPDDGTQGDGIHLVCTQEEARRKLEASRASAAPQTIVLQRYLGAPLLLDSSRGPLKVAACPLLYRCRRCCCCHDHHYHHHHHRSYYC